MNRMIHLNLIDGRGVSITATAITALVDCEDGKGTEVFTGATGFTVRQSRQAIEQMRSGALRPPPPFPGPARGESSRVPQLRV